MNAMTDLTLPAPLTKEKLLSMKLEDTVQSEGIFLGLSSEPVEWRLMRINNNVEFLFKLYYFGASIGEVCVWNDGEGELRVEAL
jgi:hypothetical protein